MNETNDSDLKALVVDLAARCGHDPDLRRRAAPDVAAHLRHYGADGPRMLLDLLEPPLALPEELEGSFTDNSWNAACGAAIVAVLEACGTDGLEALFSIAIGHAAGPESLAEEALFRLAKEGVDTETIVNRLAGSIRADFVDIEMVDQFVSVGHVTPELIDKLREVIDSMLADEVERDDQQVIVMVNALIALAPDDAEPYAPVLREWVLKGVSYGPDDENYTESDVPIMEWRAICAALVLYRLYPDEEAVREALRYWGETHVNEEIRVLIEERLKGKG